MSALVLQVSAAGRAALVNAQNTGTLPLLVSEIGITSTAFTAAADGSDTVLPGEIKRLTTFAGDAVAADTIHVSITDDTADVYDMRGFAMYFDDGTLFALYGQADPIMQKSAQAMMLLALDAIFQTIDVANLTFGDTNFALPPATTEVAGIVELATSDETTTGTDAVRAVTPAGFKAALDSRFGAGAPSTFVKSLLTAATALAFRTALAIKGAALYDTGTGNGLDADLLDGQHGSYYRAWANLTGVPAVFPPSAHQHAWADITGVPVYATRWAAWDEVTGKPATFPPSPHSQDWSTILNVPVQTTRWPAWSEVTGKPVFAAVATSGSYNDLGDKPDFSVYALLNWPRFNCNIADGYDVPDTAASRAIAPGISDAGGSGAGGTLLFGVGSINFGYIKGYFTNGSTNGIGRLVIGTRSAAGDASMTHKIVINENGDTDFVGVVTAAGYDSPASSRTVKHDIAPCRYGLAEFLQIPWVEYRYDKSITDDDRLRFGSVVEDVEPIAPLLVKHRDGQVPTFEYDQFIPVIGRALQQYIALANARADKAESRMAGMARELQELADRVALLESRV